MRFLTPTGNKRLNELIGFLCLTVAVLLAAALFSYSPRDASWNVSVPPVEGGTTGNWIGPVGSYCSDAMFSVLGFAAFLVPIAIGILGWRWFRSKAFQSQTATLIGYALLLISLPAMLSLVKFSDVRGSIPAGGFIGTLLANALSASFNKGAYLVAGAVLITAMFLTTSFSFSGTHAWASGPRGPLGAVGKLGILQRAQAKWHDWQAAREQERMRRRVEANRLGGRKPVGKAAIPGEPAKTIHLTDESDVFKGKQAAEEAEEEVKSKSQKTPILFLNQEKPEKPAKKGSLAHAHR